MDTFDPKIFKLLKKDFLKRKKKKKEAKQAHYEMVKKVLFKQGDKDE